MASILVPLAAGVEELEAVTVIDLLVRAGVKVTTAGLADGAVRASRGVTLIPDCSLDEALAHEYDMVVLPGGQAGADHLAADPRIILLLQQMKQQGLYIAAICAAPQVLAAAGVLEGRSATSYPGVLEALQLPNTRIRRETVVCDGHIITSRGPATAIEFALTLIELLVGETKRQQVAQQLLCNP